MCTSGFKKKTKQPFIHDTINKAGVDKNKSVKGNQ